MSGRLSGSTALVTGSTSGIGAAVAAALAADGAAVVVSGRDTERGLAVARQITDRGGAASFVRADLAGGADAVSALASDAVTAAGGRLDILVNNAAISVAPGPTSSLTEEDIDRVLGVNVKALLVLTGAVAPLMAARGSGAVVSMGSVNGRVGMAGFALYGATKAALESLTRSWAAEYGPSGVRVNAVVPGPTLTPQVAAMHDQLAPLMDRVPSRRASTPAEVAQAVVFLASDQAANMHGICLPVDGGLTVV